MGEGRSSWQWAGLHRRWLRHTWARTDYIPKYLRVGRVQSRCLVHLGSTGLIGSEAGRRNAHLASGVRAQTTWTCSGHSGVNRSCTVLCKLATASLRYPYTYRVYEHKYLPTGVGTCCDAITVVTCVKSSTRYSRPYPSGYLWQCLTDKSAVYKRCNETAGQYRNLQSSVVSAV